MKPRFTLFRRGRTYYCQDSETGKQSSLKTREKAEATTLLNARNEAQRQPQMNIEIARCYLAAGDPSLNTRCGSENLIASRLIDFSVILPVLYLFLVLAHERRKVLPFNITDSPSAASTAQQFSEAFPYCNPPRYLLRDRDSIYGLEFVQRSTASGLEEKLMAARSPWRNPFVENCAPHCHVLTHCDPPKS